MAKIAKTLGEIVRERLISLVDQMIDSDPESAIALLGPDKALDSIKLADVASEAIRPAKVARQTVQTVQHATSNRGMKRGTRFATKAYQVKRNRVGNPIGEPKREADAVAWKFLVRHRKPLTIIELEQATGLSNSVLRNNLYRMQNEGILETVKLSE